MLCDTYYIILFLIKVNTGYGLGVEESPSTVCHTASVYVLSFETHIFATLLVSMWYVHFLWLLFQVHETVPFRMHMVHEIDRLALQWRTECFRTHCIGSQPELNLWNHLHTVFPTLQWIWIGAQRKTYYILLVLLLFRSNIWDVFVLSWPFASDARSWLEQRLLFVYT
jgi:hypothetical protein